MKQATASGEGRMVMEKQVSCGCGGSGGGRDAPLASAGQKRQDFVSGFLDVGGRQVPVVSTRLSRADILGGWKVRWDIGRMRYNVTPGLYAVGAPVAESPVLVSANYKLSFDALRRELAGIDAWILVLDTRGINVWCAAGKGTFGTRELQQRILSVRLDRVVSHRMLILPQLGAPGVSAPEVKAASGFTVKYGPVRASDIPAFLAAGQKKDDRMRRVRFGFADRMTIAPAEVSHSWPLVLGVLGASVLLAIPFNAGYPQRLLGMAIPLLGAVLAGTVLFPAILPWLPFRAFSLKGATLGAIWTVAAALVVGASLASAVALFFMIAPIVAFLSMAFTGSSTFTCQPGAALEVRRGAIPMIVSVVLGVGLSITTRILAI
jgi:hypothetical protein